MRKYFNLFLALSLLCSIGFLLVEYVKAKEYTRALENRLESSKLRLFYFEGENEPVDTLQVIFRGSEIIITGKDLEAYPISID